ncbi:MAG: class I SAM-dependent methyltransferase [Endozoicomonas sp.]
MDYTPKSAREYIENKDHLGFLVQRDLPGLLQRYVQTGTNTLDYGCGPGMMIPLLQASGFQVEGMDISPEMLSEALKRNKRIAFTHIDSANIPRSDNSYDLAMLSYVLLEMASKEEMLPVLEEIFRVLKPGGILVSVTASEEKYKYDWLVVDNDFPDNRVLTSGSPVKLRLKGSTLTFHDYFWFDSDDREVFSKAGFTLLERHQPLGRIEDGMPWKDEMTFPLNSIYVLEKEQL